MIRESWLGRLIDTPRRRAIDRAALAVQKRAYLGKMDIFRDVDHEAMDSIERRTRMITVPKAEVIYSQDDRPRVLFLIKRGRVQLYRLSQQGKKLVLATLDPGTFFGEMPLIGESLHHTFAEAVDELLLCVMTRNDLEKMVVDYPQVGLRMLEVVARRLAESEAQREELAFRSVHARIAASLVRLFEQRADETLQVTHGDLSDMVGAYRETVTFALHDLAEEGLVALGRGRIVITDLAGLRHRSQE